MSTETSGNYTNRNLAIAFCIVSAAFVLFFNLGGRVLENNDYPHFAEIGREILETGDWVIMHNGGEIYVDKPPLHSLFMALSYKLFGVNAFACLLPAALFALIGVGATLLFGLRRDSQKWQTGVYGAMLVLSGYGFFFLARRFRNDIEYSMLFSLALFLFYEGYDTGQKRLKGIFYSLCWLCLGLACLIKGPAGLLPLAVIIVFLLASKSWGRVGGKTFCMAGAVFVAVVVPYLVLLVTHRDFPEFLELFKARRIMGRSGGIFYYIPVFFAKFFPGSILFALCAPLFWKKRKEIRAEPWLLFLCVWAGLYLFLIHFIKAKVYRYLLPVFPPLSLLTAWAIGQVLPLERWAPQVKRFWKIPAALVCLAFPLVICIKFGMIWQAIVLAAVALGIAAVAGGLMRDAVVLVCSLCVAGMLFIDVLHTAENRRVADMQQLYSKLQERQVSDKEVLVYKVTGRVRYNLSFYYNRLLQPEIDGKLEPQQGVRAVITDSVNTQDVIAVFGQPEEQLELKHHRSGDDGDSSDHSVLFYGRTTGQRASGQ